MTKLVNTQFYMKNQVRAWLASLPADHEGQLPFAEGDCFVIEMIDRPYRCVINAGGGMVSVNAFGFEDGKEILCHSIVIAVSTP